MRADLRIRNISPAAWAAAALLCLAPLPARGADPQETVVRLGPGGYLTAPPRPCKPLPDRIYRTAEVTGPMVTNQWWSSLVWQQYSQPMFAHPLVLTCTAGGLAIAYPGAAIHGNPAGIFGSGSGRGGDLTLGHSAVAEFPQADCGGYSDWFVTAAFASGEASLRASFGHGSPYVYCVYAGGQAELRFASPPVVWAGTAADPVLGITTNGHHYGLFGPSGSAWEGLGSATLVNQARGQSHFSLALLPDSRPETLALFRRHAHAHVSDTRVSYRVDGGTLHSSYRFALRTYEGPATETLFALYPHHWKYATAELTGLSYGSVRGTMKVASGSGFQTSLPVQGVLPMFPAEGIPDRQRIVGYLQAEAARMSTADFGDTYWEGKRLGRLATLSGIAEACGERELRDGFVGVLKRRLENWFTASAGKEQPVFYYDSRWGTLVGSRPSYGSDNPLNDHHFHYGYFLRAAAEVARVDPAWAAKWKPLVQLIIREIAATDPQDAMFPYLRCFDKYAGHSWASGDANFADGNNQESSSESMNAWYGMILWGQATGDTAVRDTGLFLFNTERTAVEEYWFDVSGTNFPPDFPHVALGMVWGGKGAFGTWFSGDIDCIHGINWLPFTPASIYMGRWPAYVAKNHARILQGRPGGTDYNTGWGDLVVMFSALSDPAAAAAYIDAHPDCKIEGGNSHAFMYHWIHTLNVLGINEPTVTADYPLSAVFVKDGLRSYAAYNFQSEPLTVTFSDGVQLLARPQTLTLQRAAAAGKTRPAAAG